MIGAIFIVLILSAFGICVTAVLTFHQRKMAEIIHASGAQQDASLAAELHALRAEVAVLRDTVNGHTLAIDSTPVLQRQPPRLPAGVSEQRR